MIDAIRTRVAEWPPRVRRVLAIGLIVGVLASVNIFQPVDLFSSNLRAKLFTREASGHIVVVPYQTVVEFRRSRSGDSREGDQLSAELLEALANSGASLVMLNSGSAVLAASSGDAEMRRAATRLGSRLVLPAIYEGDLDPAHATPSLLTDATARFAAFSGIIHALGYFWEGRALVVSNSQVVPTFAGLASSSNRMSDDPFLIDYTIDARTVPQISAGAIRKYPDIVSGRVVYVENSEPVVGSGDRIPGTMRSDVSTWVNVLSAETLIAGNPRHLGSIPVLIMMIGILLLHAARERATPSDDVIAASGAAAVVVLAWSAGLLRWNFEVVPALVAAGVHFASEGRDRLRARLARTSSFSGLPNFTAFREQETGDAGAIVALRVRGWEEIGASLSVDAMRGLAAHIARRIAADGGTTVYHEGGDAFAWAVEARGPSLERHLTGLRALFRQPVRLGARDIDVNIHVGVDTSHSLPPDQRLSAALAAALEARERKLEQARFDAASLADADWSMSLHSHIDGAIANGELWVAYQPKVDVRSGRWVGAEALIRWTHPERGAVAPAEFVSYAEQTGRIDLVTRFVLDRVAELLSELEAIGEPLVIAVNLSPALLHRADVVDWVEDALRRSGAPASRLMLEITETHDAGDLDDAAGLLDRLRALGVRLSLDDFGTGAANLEHLAQLRVDELKLDRRFVERIATSRIDRAIVEATVTLARSAGLTLVAEGVADQETLACLRTTGCHQAQGFGLARPMGVVELLRQLEVSRSRNVGTR